MRSCTCTGQPRLCEACVAQQLAWLGGAAACRGSYWAESVVRRLGRRRIEPAPTWPRYDDSARLRHLALARIADMTRDPVLGELLARACAESAREEFESLMSRFENG